MSNTNLIRFVLDREIHVVDDQEPTTTVLQYLREYQKRTGTKEGCAEGDCGACTVVMAELDGDSVRYRPVNACIQFLPTLDGKALFTVESLKKIAAGPDNRLHPVQQAMVDCHASQCGFCTPGFVMSMFALYLSNKTPTDADIRYALSGNLCRCTGYRPIITATNAMYELDDPAPASFDTDIKGMLNDIRVSTDKEINTDTFHYIAPSTIDSLADACARVPDATILAGGTDVGLWVTKQYKKLPEIIYIGNVADLDRVDVHDDYIEIGASVPLCDAFEVLLDEYPDFEEIWRRFASPPICNSGTLCGNVANGSPIGDSMPGLIALGAQCVLQCRGKTRVLPLEDFYIGYMEKDLRTGEFVRSVRVPRSRTGTIFRSYKIAKRYDQDISAVCAAFCLDISDETITRARVCFGGMAAAPKRATGCEEILEGAKWDAAATDKAVAALSTDFQPIADMRASVEFRQQVAGNLLRRFFAETGGVANRERPATNVWDYAEQRA